MEDHAMEMNIMTKRPISISYKKFASNLDSFFERVALKNETIIVEKPNGDRVVLKPASATKATRRRRRRTAADYEAFLSSAGSWKDVDTDKLIKDIYESRRISSKPPVEL
jgi:hypothetical protein